MDSKDSDRFSDQRHLLIESKANWLIRMTDESQNRYLIFGPFSQAKLCQLLLSEQANELSKWRIDSKTEIGCSLSHWISLSDEQDMIQFFDHDFVVKLRQRVSITHDGEPTVAIQDSQPIQSAQGQFHSENVRNGSNAATKDLRLKNLDQAISDRNKDKPSMSGVESTGLFRGLAWLLVFGLLILAYVVLRFSRELGLDLK